MFSKFVSFFLFLIPFTSALPLVTSPSEQLVLLVDQVYPDITTYLDKDQISQLFNEFVKVLRDAETVEEMARGMSKPIIAALTPDQRKETWESVQKAQNGFGGFQQLKVILFHAMDAVQAFMGDAMQKDRAEIEKNSNGKSDGEVKSMVLEVLRQYFNVEFAQKIMDTVKYSMTEQDWEIATADAAKYMNVDNFNLRY